MYRQAGIQGSAIAERCSRARVTCEWDVSVDAHYDTFALIIPATLMSPVKPRKHIIDKNNFTRYRSEKYGCFDISDRAPDLCDLQRFYDLLCTLLTMYQRSKTIRNLVVHDTPERWETAVASALSLEASPVNFNFEKNNRFREATRLGNREWPLAFLSRFTADRTG